MFSERSIPKTFPDSEHGLKLPALVDALDKALNAAPGEAKAADKDWYAAPLGELVRHIVETHHGYMKTALPRLMPGEPPPSGLESPKAP